MGRRGAPAVDREDVRKAVHMFFGLFLALIYINLPRNMGLAMLSLGVFAAISYDVIRTRARYTTPFRGFLEMVVRPRERGTIGGQTYFLAGGLMAAMLFPGHPAFVGMSVTSVSDAVAAFVGRRFKRIVIAGGRSAEGVLAAVASGMLVTALVSGFSLPLLLGVGLAVAVSELSSLIFDDNLVYPIASGIAVYLLGGYR